MLIQSLVNVFRHVLSAHLEQGIEEYLRQRLRHSKMAVAGADLEGGLQTLYRNCGDRIMLMRYIIICEILR